MDLSPTQLRTLLAVARHLSYSRAAEELFLTQPAVSMHIRKLERAIGAPVFEQLGRSIVLTKPGQLLVAYAEQSLSLQEEFRDALAASEATLAGSLAIGASTTIGVSLLPSFLQAFLVRFPAMSMRLQVGNVPEVVQATLAGHLDLGVISGNLQDDRLVIRAIMDDELVLVVPPQHPMAGWVSVEPSALAKERLVLRERGSTTRTLVDEWLTLANGAPAVVAEVNNNEVIARVVELGVGVSIMSRFAVATLLESGRLCHVPLEGGLCRPVQLVTHKHRRASPAVRAFERLLDEWVPPV